MRPLYLFLFCLILTRTAHAQVQDTSVFSFPIKMDSVVVRAARGGWDVQGFIRRVQRDTTFEKAFKGLHVTSFAATNDIRMLGKDGSVKASLLSHTVQKRTARCRTMRVLDEKVTGDFYKRNREYRYYTALLYAYLFFTKDSVCNETDIVAIPDASGGNSGLEHSKRQLKQLIFSPGSKVRGVPFMGDKASIFDPDIAKLYDFRLESTDYAGEECYLFRAIPKKEHIGEVVYNDLSTWFRITDYSIVARDYALSFHTMLYDFDVQMKVRLTKAGKRLIPGSIEYNGDWKVVTKPRERARFTATFTY